MSKSPFLRVGVPMIGAIVLASYGLSFVLERKFELRDARNPTVSIDERDQIELFEAAHRSRKVLSLEEEYLKMNSQLDIEHWDNRRVPRPPGLDEEAEDYYLDGDNNDDDGQEHHY
jgi:Cytochrome c oxidase assembly protein COX16